MKRESIAGNIVSGQQGMALVSALLLLLVVTLMALGVSTDTSMDVRIAAYQRFKARAFGSGEAGMMTATEILEDNIFDAGWEEKLPSLPNDLPLPGLSVNYDGNIDILGDRVFYMHENTKGYVRIRMTGDIQARIVPQRVVSKLAKGGAIQVAAGYAGMGKGVSGGGGHVIYNLISRGTDADQARVDLGLYYRHVEK